MNLPSIKWDRRFMDLAQLVATWSKDPERQVGAVLISPDRLVAGIGYNGPPRGVEYKLEVDRLPMTVHAEVNAILNAIDPVHGTTLYSTYFPCAACAGVIIQAGIIAVISPKFKDGESRWAKSWDVSAEMFEQANVDWRYQI